MNSILPQQQIKKETFGTKINAPATLNLINSTLGSAMRGKKFVASITSAVATNQQLAKCEFSSIINGALVGEALNLSPSPVLGHYYLVPFDLKDRGLVAQFQLGYKGYVQLAMRSGHYKKLNVVAIKKGELVKYDPIEEEIEVNLIEDDEVRENTETIGYYAFFEYVNGFKKCLYWSRKKMEAHALKYSKGYKAKKGYTFWEKDFDGMAYKTMLRQLISKWGIMSLEMQKAFESDMAVIKEVDGDNVKVDYIDNDDKVEFNDQPQQLEEQPKSNIVDEVEKFKARKEQEKIEREEMPYIEQETLDFNNL